MGFLYGGSWYFILGVVLFLFGCGAKDTAELKRDSSSEREEVSIRCNSFSAEGFRMTGKVRSYRDSAGSESEDIHEVHFSDISQDFISDPDYKIRFFRWKVHGGVSDLDREPLQFRLEIDDRFGQYHPVSGYMNHMNREDILRIKHGELGRRFELQQMEVLTILKKLRVVVFGTEFSYQVLRLVAYKGVSIEGKVDMLLPIFGADPLAYGKSHRELLTQLHPFYDRDLTKSDLEREAHALCSGT